MDKKDKCKSPITKAIALFALIFFLSFIFFYDLTDLFVLPFQVEVWGTASDWTMVIITAISAMYIARTLNEQKNINKNSLLPIFKVEEQPKQDPNRGCPIIKIKLVKNSAYDFACSRAYGTFIPDTKRFPLLLYLAEGEVFEIECSLNPPTGDAPVIETLMTFSFKDISSNCYCQDITYDKWRKLYTLSTPRVKDEIGT